VDGRRAARAIDSGSLRPKLMVAGVDPPWLVLGRRMLAELAAPGTIPGGKPDKPPLVLGLTCV
jgi:hypothetical protein